MPDNGKRSEGRSPELSDLIPLSEAAKLSGLSMSQLRLLVSQGEIWGVKPGRNWYTTEQAVREYLARDIRPGPKPKK
jgi:excisionase family DNA binding protein